MDVVCGRCRAEYEFDDALISERGTTVRCTNCGLQFKVFPPMGQRAPEIWRLFDPGNPGRPCAEYASLGRLQKAIARGEVSPKHMLARGSEAPRPLMDIAELEPLLKQPQSEPPPERRMPQALRPPAMTTDSTTKLGIETRPDPLPAITSDSVETGVPEDEEVVPASTPPEDPVEYADIVMKAGATPHKDGDHRPKIRSALSRGAELVVPVTEDDTKKATLVPRTPLRTALQSSQANGPPPSSDPQPPLRRSAYSSPLDDDRTSETKLVMDPWEAPPPELGREDNEATDGRSGEEHPDDVRTSDSPDAPPSSVTRSVPPSSGRRKATENTKTTDTDAIRHTDNGGTSQPEEEALAQSGADPGELPDAQPWEAPSIQVSAKPSTGGRAPTPTPLAMRAYTNSGAEPASASPHLPATLRARSTWLILSVVLGSVAFLALSNRDKMDSQPEAGSTTTAPAAPNEDARSEARAAVQHADVVWLKAVLDGRPLPSDFPELTERVQRAFPESWWIVDALRITGNLTEARRVAAGLEVQRGAYSLALLDFAESTDDPPWPVVLKRLRAAATGDKSPYLARSALIYALLASDQPTAAIAEYESWSRLPDAQTAPLYGTLTDLIDKSKRRSTSTDVATRSGSLSEASHTTEQKNAALFHAEAREEDVPGSKPAPSDPKVVESEPAPRPPKAPEKAAEPAPPTVPNAIRDKVDQADSLWRTGNRDAALKLYREVVATIGTSHFLGVRANSRIRQAEREKATHP